MDFEETLGGSLCNTEYPVSFCKVPAGDFLDESGSSIPLAANGSSEFGFPDADGNFSITGSLRAVETVPDHMTLRARNYDTGEIYGIAEMR